MSDILHDVSPPALMTGIEKNLFDFLPLFGLLPQAEVHDGPDLLWSLTNVPFPICNSILRANLAPEAVDGAMEMSATKFTHQDDVWRDLF